MLDVLRPVPKPLVRRFFGMFETDFASLGIDVDTDPDVVVDALYPELLPERMRLAISRIADLSSKWTVDGLIEATGGALPPDARRLDPASIAMLVWLDHRDAFETAHGLCACPPIRRFRLFAGREAGAPTELTDRALPALNQRLSASFSERGWGSLCEVTRLAPRSGWCFDVSHGEPREIHELCDSATMQRLSREEIVFRARQRNRVIYYAHRGLLEVEAPDAATIELYRARFGELLFGDADWFTTDPVVSLTPLFESGSESLLPTAQIERVQLASLEISLPGQRGTITVQGDEVLDVVTSRLGIALGEGTLRSLRLRVRVVHGRVGTVEVRPPNTVRHDLPLDDDRVLDFLRERGFLGVRSEVRP